MSLGLNRTKRRISSIESTQKITKAMEMIATVKLKGFKDSFEASEAYLKDMTSLLSCLFNYDEDTKSHYYKENDEAKGTLYIVITSSLGLCGGYNSNIFKYVESIVDKENDYILPIGEKGRSYFKRDKDYKNPRIPDLDFDFTTSVKDLYLAANILKNMFNEGKVKKIVIVYTHYVNSLSFIPEQVNLLPLSLEYKPSENELICPPLFNPSPREALHLILVQYLAGLINGKVVESRLSEFASRRNATENANDNADELLSQLRIEYNKARQSAITQEIVEVVGGANASK